ncbi:MAG TPA: hypothetical protein VK348_04635 [Planctomycetota bacterium]|nr:hypothetical protein [Planctomycetota bacterium]
MRTRASSAFPVGLYGVMLLALCALALPRSFAPIERLLLGAASMPLRAFAAVAGVPASADSGMAAAVQSLQQRLAVRVHAQVTAGGKRLLASQVSPLVCAVVAGERKGGGGLPCELRLQRCYRDLRDCLPLVTSGDALVGFLARPGEGPAARDRDTDPALVLLLNHPDAHAVAAQLQLDGGNAPLHLVVEAAAAVDPAPLRTALWDDPYRASRLQQGGLEVRSAALPAAPWACFVPDGLLLGHARVWGYTHAGATLTIGVYVDAPFDSRALSHVALWRADDELPGAPVPATGSVPAVLWPLPGGDAGRSHLTASLLRPLPDGAAVVQDGICFGTVRALAFGQGLVTSFAASRRRWALLLLPDDGEQPPQELVGEVAFQDHGTACVRLSGSSLPQKGYLFTGSNGLCCPPGLLLGRAEPDADSGLLRVVAHQLSGPSAVEVVVPAEDHL